ncbi:hypothetical protein FRC11_014196 [Ceratobasidium sp. 423]|nr:hypothetical protein FRC11_014196 [Ceratobasidium sp. 423]
MSIRFDPSMAQLEILGPSSATKKILRAGNENRRPTSGGSVISSQGSLFEFPQKKKQLTILLVGQTGGGKTAFMSLLLNLFQGNGPFELVDKHNLGAESGLKASQSQTTKATLYSCTTPTGIKLQILDTPGLADTRGFDTDNAHREAIQRAIIELIETIDAILIVANGGVTRLDALTNHTLDVLASLFPQSIVSNIGFIFTHTADVMGLNFPISDLRPELREATRRKFLLDNPLSLCKAYTEQSTHAPASERELGKMKRRLEAAYTDSIESVEELLEWLDQTNPQPTNEIIRLYELSATIEGRLQATLASLKNATKLHDEITGLKRRSTRVGERKTSLLELLNDNPRKGWILIDSNVRNTICIVAGCHSNCHPNSTLNYTESPMLDYWFNTIYTWVIPNALRWGNFQDVACTECKHPAKYHRNYKSIHQEVHSKHHKRIREALERENKTQDGLDRTQGIIQAELDELMAEIEEAKAQIQNLIAELNQISLTPNFAGRIRSSIQLLEVHKRGLESGPGSSIEMKIVDEALSLFRTQLELIGNKAEIYPVVTAL